MGLAELALSGCTTSTDHLYVHPAGAGDLISAEIEAAADLGVRFHPTRGSMSLSVKDGGLPPDSTVQTDDVILAESERLVAAHHDPSPGAMVRIALAPCSPFSVTTELMTATAELAERLDVRLHTHLAEDIGEDDFCLETFGMRPVDYFEHCGWGTDRSWIAHCVQPNPAEISRLGRWGTGVAHCPSSNMILGAGLAPVRELRAAGVPVGLGVDGSASADSGSMWTEARNAMLMARLRDGQAGRTGLFTAREALEMATRGGAACLGRAGEIGELTVGACGDIAVWRLDGFAFAGRLVRPDRGVAAVQSGFGPPHHRRRPSRGGVRRAESRGHRADAARPPPHRGRHAVDTLNEISHHYRLFRCMSRLECGRGGSGATNVCSANRGRPDYGSHHIFASADRNDSV